MNNFLPDNLRSLVTIVIPSYNYGHFIEETIDSILQQRYTNYEIIVIDDGSTDNTREVLQCYGDRINYIYQENQGLSAARNHGLQLASGEYIIFLDADDFLLPHILEKQVAALDNNSDLGFVICGWHIVNETGEILSDVELWHGLPQLNAEAWVKWRPLLPSATLFRRHWLEKVDGFSTEAFPAEDIDCVLRMVALGCQSDWVKSIGVCYRQHGQTITQNTERQVAAFERLYDRFFARADLTPEVRKLEKETRYNTLIWCAWRLYHTGRLARTIEYLRKSLQYTSLSPVETINNWISFFDENCQGGHNYQFDAYSFTTAPGWNDLIETTLQNKPPRVSIIIPVYNGERYLQQTLESVFAQTHTDYEVIVIDDGSTDNTLQILESNKDSIRYVTQENQGVSAARNRGLYLARGELVAFLDADDLFLPHKLEKQIAVFDRFTDVGIVNSGFRIINDADNTIVEVKWWKDIPKLNDEAWLLYKPVLPSAMMFRRFWLERVGGFDRRFFAGEDIDITLRMIAEGCKAQWLNEITTCYRIHNSSVTRGNTPKQVQNTEAMLNNFFNQSHLPQSIRVLEQQSRYQSLVWMAWLLYQTGYRDEMVTYLEKSLQYTSYSWAELISDWMTTFTNSSQGLGEKLNVPSLINSVQWQQIMSKVKTVAV